MAERYQVVAAPVRPLDEGAPIYVVVDQRDPHHPVQWCVNATQAHRMAAALNAGETNPAGLPAKDPTGRDTTP